MFVFCSIAPIPSHATAGWQTLHIGTYTIPGSTGEKKTPIVYSGGGNFQVCVYDLQPYNGYILTVYEDDGTSMDTIVDSRYTHNNSASSTNCTTLYDIGNYVDGDNNKAEFYVKIGPADFTDTVVVELND